MAFLKSLFALSLLAFPAAAVVVATGTVIPEGWSILDSCAVDVPGRLLKSIKINNLNHNTPMDCVSLCDSQGYTFAGVEYGKECQCGRGYDSAAAVSAPVSECSMPCAGDASQKCGSGWRLQVYVSNSKLPASPALPSGWSTAYGCAVNSGDRVLLENKMNTLPKTNSPATCVKMCDSLGYTHAGVEFGSECHCGRGYAWEPVSAPIDECNMDCTGNSFYNCGAGRRISIYTLDSASPPTPAPAAPAPSTIAVSGTVGVYNKATGARVGYVSAVNGGRTYIVSPDAEKALNVQFKFSTVPFTPFSIRITDDSPYGYLGAIQGSNFMNQCPGCGEWYDELVNVEYSKFGQASAAVSNGFDDIAGGKRRSQATMWILDTRTNILGGVWMDSNNVGQKLNTYLYTVGGMSTYMNADLEAWKRGAHPAMGDYEVDYKFEGPIPSYTPTCQGVSGWQYTSTGGKKYDVACQKDYAGNDLAFIQTSSLASCMNICSSYNGCVGVTFVVTHQTCCLKHTVNTATWYKPPLELVSAALLA